MEEVPMIGMWKFSKDVAGRTGVPTRTVFKIMVQSWLVAHGVTVWMSDFQEEHLRAVAGELGFEFDPAIHTEAV